MLMPSGYHELNTTPRLPLVTKRSNPYARIIMPDFQHDNREKVAEGANGMRTFDGMCQVECRDSSCNIPERRGFRPALRWVVGHHHSW